MSNFNLSPQVQLPDISTFDPMTDYDSDATYEEKDSLFDCSCDFCPGCGLEVMHCVLSDKWCRGPFIDAYSRPSCASCLNTQLAFDDLESNAFMGCVFPAPDTRYTIPPPVPTNWPIPFTQMRDTNPPPMAPLVIEEFNGMPVSVPVAVPAAIQDTPDTEIPTCFAFKKPAKHRRILPFSSSTSLSQKSKFYATISGLMTDNYPHTPKNSSETTNTVLSSFFANLQR